MHHNSVFYTTPHDSWAFFFCVDLVIWLPFSPLLVFLFSVVAAYFPLCFQLLLTFSLFYLFNLFLSLLDSLIVIVKQRRYPPHPSFSASLTSPRCSYQHYGDIFSVNTYYFALSPSFSLLPHSVFFRRDAWEDLPMFFFIMQMKAHFPAKTISSPSIVGNNSH